MTQLLIARHGNTFEPGETPTRVGARTDLPLTATGKAQAETLGLYLRQQGINPAVIYAGELQRSYQTALLAQQKADWSAPLLVDAAFNEIDYGIDENCSDAMVVARIGQAALTAWDETATVPPGWPVDVAAIINHWQQFARLISQQYPEQTVLVVTSNGIARFAPYLTGDWMAFRQQYALKMATGAYGHLRHHPSLPSNWEVVVWNQRPPS